MLKSDAVKYFGSQYKLAAALGIKQPSVARWPDEVPAIWQIRIENATGGDLLASAEARRVLHPKVSTQ